MDTLYDDKDYQGLLLQMRKTTDVNDGVGVRFGSGVTAKVQGHFLPSYPLFWNGRSHETGSVDRM